LISSTSQTGLGKEGVRSLNLVLFYNTYSKFKINIRDDSLDYRCSHQKIGKGAIGLTLNITDKNSLADNQLFIVTTHLPFDDKRPEQANPDRLDCLNGAIMKFGISNKDSLLMFGDLNFRTKEGQDIQIVDFLNQDKDTASWIKDSVSVAISKNMNVVKTCKLKVGRDPEICKANQYKDCYELGTEKKPRDPSYCDRILFTSDLDLVGYETFDIGGTQYTDHLIVAGLFSYTINSGEDFDFEQI
jgi:hypothetical protein